MKLLVLVLALLITLDAYSSVFIFGSGEATNLTKKIGFSGNDQKIVSNETADPSSSGYAAGEGSLLFRDNSNTGELWLKLFSGNTDWVRMLYAQDNGSELLGFTYKQFNTESYAEHGAIANFNTGNNATFDGGGTISGTLAKIAASLIDTTDASNYQFTQAAGSLNDYFTFKQFNIDNGVGAGIRFRYQYDGADDDLEVEVKCMTSGTVYSLGLLEAASTTKTFSEYFFAPSGCGEARIGISVATLNSGKIIKFNRWIVSGDPTIFKNVYNATDWEAYTPTTQGFGTTSGSLYWRRDGPDVLIMGKFTSGTVTASEARIGLPSGLTSASTSIIPSIQICGHMGKSTNAVTAVIDSLIEPSVTYLTVGVNYSNTRATLTKINASDIFGNTEDITLFARVPIAGWVSESEHYVTPQAGIDSMIRLQAGNGHGSTDNKIRRFSNIALGPSGVFGAIATTQTNGDITVTDSAANGTIITVNKDGFYVMSYNDVASGGGTQYGISLNSTELTTAVGTITAQSKLGIAYVNSTSGVDTSHVAVPIFLRKNDVIRAHTASTNIASTSTQVRFTITKIGFNSLSAIPVQKTVYLKDVKTSGTDGGSITGGAPPITRTLNTITGDSSIVVLSSNQFTLSKGVYELEASAPAFATNRHQAFLYDVTNSLYLIDGTPEFSPSAGSTNRSIIQGKLTLAETTTFEIRHWASATASTNGLGTYGYDTNNPQSGEVYTIVKITKVVTNDN